MHNSNNPAVGKVIFTSTLLAQAKLLGISTNINNSTTKKLPEAVNTVKCNQLLTPLRIKL